MSNEPFTIGKPFDSEADLSDAKDSFIEVEVDSEISPLNLVPTHPEILEEFDNGDSELTKQLYERFPDERERTSFIAAIYTMFESSSAIRDSAKSAGKRVNVLVDKENGVEIGARGIKDKLRTSAWNNSISKIDIPLMHSGFVIRIKKYRVRDYVNLLRAASLEEIKVARETMGISTLLKSSVADYIFLEMLRDLIVTHNVEGVSNRDIVDHIVDLDLSTIRIFLLQTMYPEGHPFELPCMSKYFGVKITEDGEDGESHERECDHVRKGLIKFNNIWTFNKDRLSDDQLKFMSLVNTKRKLEDVLNYQKGIVKSDDSVTIGSIKFNFKLATTEQKAVAYRVWLDDIATSIDKTFSSKLSVQAKEQQIADNLELAQLRNYLPFIASFEIVSDDLETENIVVGTNTPEGKAELIEILTDMSDDESASKFTKAIDKFVSQCNLVDIGIHNDACPECGSTYGGEAKSYLLPLDVSMLFFVVMGMRRAWHQTKNTQ